MMRHVAQRCLHRLGGNAPVLACAAGMGAGLGMHQRSTLRLESTHADSAGLTGGAGWSGMNADGVVDGAPRTDSDHVIAKMGKPVHINCCPTGTMQFAGDSAACVDATKATVMALTTQMSTHPPKFIVLYGSLRKDSKSRMLAIEVGRQLSTYGAEVHVFDPEGLPVYSEDIGTKHPKVAELRSLVRWCEGMVWISPEIHGNISAAFKNQVDWMPLSEGAIRPTQGKTVAVMQIEAGSQSFNTVNNLRTLGRWMRCIVIPNQGSIPQAYKHFNEDGTLKESSYRDRVVDVIDELYKFTLLLRDQQDYMIHRYSEQKAAHEKHIKQCKYPASNSTLRSLQSPIVLDVRSLKERNAAKGGVEVEGSIHVPLNVDGQPQSVHETTADELRKKLVDAGVFPIAKDTNFITHCTSGTSDYVGRGTRAAALLRDLGYKNAYNGGSADEIRAARS